MPNKPAGRHRALTQRYRPLFVWLACAALTGALFAPFFQRGTVFLLDYGDYPVGPRPLLSPAVWGFPPGLISRAPVNALFTFLYRNIQWGPTRVLPFVIVPFMAGWGFARLFSKRPLPTIASTFIYVLNPFIYERMFAGQIYFVLGYSLLPLLISLLPPISAGNLRHSLTAGLLMALMMALAPHFLFICALLVLGLAAVSLVGRRFRALEWLGIAVVVTGVVSLYWLIPSVGLTRQLQGVTLVDVGLFRTTPDSRFGLLPNVVALYGFWHTGAPLTKEVLNGWPIYLASILLVAGIGAVSGIRKEAGLIVVGLLAAAVVAFFLALGDQGPAGRLFVWSFQHLPGFRIMREPQKFLSIVALAYAFLFGMGVETLHRDARRRGFQAVVALALLTLPVAYNFRMFWGFSGNVKPSHYPTSWAEADHLMKLGPEKVLALPWHQYLALPWTQKRVVANPMASYFHRDVVVGDNPEYGGLQGQTTLPRSHYLEFLFRRGARIKRFGNLIAPLDIRFVLLSKTVDWRKYEWLYFQDDLRLVREWDDLALFENHERSNSVYAPQSAIELEDWGEVVALGQRGQLTAYGGTVNRAAPGRIKEHSPPIPRSLVVPVVSQPRSPVQYDIRATRPTTLIALSQPFAREWTFHGKRAASNFGITNLFEVRPGQASGSIQYGRWRLVRIAYVIGALSVVFVVGLLAIDTVRRRNAARLAIWQRSRPRHPLR